MSDIDKPKDNVVRLYDFNGPEYNPSIDQGRLSKQYNRIFRIMSDGQWRTYEEIASLSGDPENSISAQLRHMRKPRFGSHVIERRSRDDREKGLYEYRLTVNHEGVIEDAPQKFHGGQWYRKGGSLSDGALTVRLHKHKIEKHLTLKEQRLIVERVKSAILEAEREIARARAVPFRQLYLSFEGRVK